MLRCFWPILFVLTACQQDKDRIAQLEKQTAELQQQVKALSLDVQSKCAAVAKTYFTENWNTGDESTISLDYTNHYNEGASKCFVRVDHFILGPRRSWAHTITIVDVFERTRYGIFAENHTSEETPKVTQCMVSGLQCKSLEEFNEWSQPLMMY